MQTLAFGIYNFSVLSATATGSDDGLSIMYSMAKIKGFYAMYMRALEQQQFTIGWNLPSLLW